MPVTTLTEYLAMASENGIQDFALSRSNLAANLRRCIEAELKELANALADAALAHLILEKPEELLRMLDLRQRNLQFSTGSRDSSGEPLEITIINQKIKVPTGL